jgi:hypothetical protein
VRTFSVAVCVLAAAVIWIAAGIGTAPSQADDDTPHSSQPSSAGSGKLGSVTLTPDQQHQIGLQTAVLESAAHSEQIRAYGAVVDVARITDLTNSYANAQAQLQTARARFDVAKSAFERAQSLVRSAILAKRDAEAAEGTYLTDQAALVAAESQLKTLAATAQQEWGSVLGKGIVERSSQIVRLIERDQFLVQVTLPPGVVLAEPPRAALAQAPTRNANIDLHFISPATRTDARIQGLSYFFVASGDSSLLPGMNTIVYVPSGKSYEGVFLEDTAIVQWQGRSWVYLRVAPDTFKRHPINTDQPVSDDDYVVQDIPPGSEIVVRGAQVLLSEEAKSELRGSGDND